MYPSEKFPDYGVFVRNIVGRLVQSNIDVDKCVIEKQESPVSKVVAYLRFIVVGAWKYHRRDYGLAYVHYISHSYLPLIFARFHRHNKILVNVHGSDVLREQGVSGRRFAVKRIVSKLALRDADGVVVPSKYYRDVLIKEFGVRPSKIHVVASGGIDRTLFKPREAVSQDGFLIGYVGRLDRDKGVGTLLHAIRLVREQRNDVRCMIVGDGAARQELEDLAVSLGLGDSVEFLGVRIQPELPGLLSALDVFVFPTERLTESLGLVGLEAMACGAPVIGSRIGGLKSYLEDGVNGFFFEPGNAEDLARKIMLFRGLEGSEKMRLSNEALITAGQFDAAAENRKLMTVIESIAYSS